MPNLFNLSFAVLSAALAGCAQISPVPTASRSNPANPSAAAAGYPAAVPVLMTGNNYAMSPEGNAQPMKMDMKMDVPAAGSVPVETPQHEGHAQPSEAPHPHEHHEANPPKQ